MARNTNIKLRRSATAGAIPTTSNLDLGEIAINTYDGKLYAKTTEGSDSEVIQVGSATDSYHKIRKSQTLSFTVTVASKTSDHAFHGSGSGSGYFIDGLQSPHIHLVPGNTYRFDQSDSSNSGHPLRFYYEADKTTAYTTGVTTNGTPGSSGAYTQIVPTESTPTVLFYQCSAHGYMGNRADFGTRNLTGFDTDDLSEGSSNLYHTTARARAAVSASGDLSYNSSTGVFSFSHPTMYADGDARSAISVTDAGGDGSLAYNSSTGVITYTGPSASEVRAHFTAGTGVSISSGEISIGQAVATNSNVSFGNITTVANVTTTGNVIVGGNLTVSGTTTTLNTATLDVEDKNITLNAGSGDTSGSANGAGLTIQDAVDSSTDATLLWDATNDRFDFSHPLEITNNGTTDTLLLTSTEASSTAAPVLTFKRNSGSPADADYLGQLKFKGENDADQEVVYAKVTAKVQDATDGTEDGILEFANVKAGSNTITARLRSDSLQLLNGTSLVVAGLTYPTSDGSSGQVLQTDGSGTLSFATVSSGTSGVTVQEEGSSLSTAGTTLNFVGSGVTASGTGSTKTITVSGGEITVQDEGSALSTAASTLNFVGSGVVASGTGSTKTITISGTGSSQSASYKEYLYVASGSQSTFTGADANGDTLAYTAGFLNVYLNGVKLRPSTDFTASNGTSVVLVNASSNGDVLQIETFVQVLGFGDSSLSELSGDGSTTTFTIAANPNHENNTQVFVDGVYQEKGTYSVSGTTLTFSAAPPNGSSIEVVIGNRNVTIDDATGLTVNGDTDLNGTLNVSGHLSLDGSANELRFYEGSNFVGFEAPALSGDQIWVLPNADGSSGQALKTDGSGNLSWGTAGDNAFANIAVSGQTTVSADSTSDTLTLVAGTGITLATNASSDEITITNSSTGGNSFGNIAVSGQTTVAADQATDTLTLAASDGISITTTAGSDTVTIAGTSSVNPFSTDLFTTANSSTTAFTLSVAPPSEDNLIVFVEGVYQNKNSYSVSGTTLTLDSAPLSGAEVVVHQIGNGITGSAMTVDEFTGDGSTAAYTLSINPISENNTFVYIDGVYQEKGTYAVSGTTLTFDSNIANGHSIEVVMPTTTQINQPATDSINAIGMFDDTTIMGSAVTSTTMTTTSATTIATHAAATYRTIKYIVQLTQGTDYHSTEVSLIHDGTTVYITEYGTLFDNAVLGTLSATISSGNILLQVTPGSNSSLTARVVSTAIPV